MIRRCAGRAGLVLLCAVAVGNPADSSAHTRSTSSSRWVLEAGPDAEAALDVRVPWLELQRAVPGLDRADRRRLLPLSESARAIDRYLQEHFRLFSGRESCAPLAAPTWLATRDPEQLARSWRVRCGGPAAVQIRIDAFFADNPSHLHLARIQQADRAPFERIFAAGTRALLLEGWESQTGREPAAGAFADFVRLGTLHIASGSDHLVFLLALLLLGTSVRSLAALVTAFTIAHSLTLGVAVLGWVTPRAATVESLIGLSIAVVALENFAFTMDRTSRRAISRAVGLAMLAAASAAQIGWLATSPLALAGIGLFSVCTLELFDHTDRPERLRWFVAFAFGLIHGFGFAGILAEVGLPPDRVASSLFGFNLGVEIGQLAIVAASWPVLRWLLGRDREPIGDGAHLGWKFRVQLGSAPVLAAGIFWFLTRA